MIDAALSSQPAAGISPSPRRPPLPRSASSNSRNSSRNNSFRRPPQLAVPPAPVRPPGEGGGLPEPPEPQAPAGGSAPLKVSQEWFRDLPDPLKAMERLMKSDPQMFKRIQASMRGIGSLATETTELNMKRDRTGATVINQYVVIKTLGQGSYGKVKLVLNTLDGQLYAVKMVLRTGAMASNRASSLLRKGSRARQNSMRLNDSGVLPPLLSELNGGRKARSLRETDTQSLFETERSQSLRESGGSSHSSTLPHAQRERLRPLGLKSSSIDEATVDEERRSLSLNCLPTVTVDEERRSQSLSGVETAPTSTVHSSPSGSGRVGSGRVGSGRVDLHGSSLGGAPLGGMALAESLGVQKVDQEIAIMKKMDHPHVVKLHEVIDPPGSK